MDVLQTALVLMVLIVCIFLIIFGIMFFLILREIKKGFDKLNHFLETSEQVAAEIGKPMAAAAGLVSAIGAGAKAAGMAARAISQAVGRKNKSYPKIKEVKK